jgi:uncharacterized protein (DUF58 family)
VLGVRFWHWFHPLTDPLACVPQQGNTQTATSREAFLRQLARQLQLDRQVSARQGLHKSNWHGQGLDFKDLRLYQPGDDLRRIDWNVLARTQTPYIRQYEVETQKTIWLFLDGSLTMHFGSQRAKLDLMLELLDYWLALTRYSASALGCVVVPAQGTIQWIPPRSNRAGLGAMAQEISAMLQSNPSCHTTQQPSQANPDYPKSFLQTLQDTLPTLKSLCQKQTTLVVISDFLSASAESLRPVAELAKSCSVWPVRLVDPVEIALPQNIGLLSCIDPVTGKVLVLDTHNSFMLDQYQQLAAEQFQKTDFQLRRLTGRVPMVLQTNMSSDTVLSEWLKQAKGVV